MGFYPLIRRLLFLVEPEKVHHITVQLIKIGLRIPLASKILKGDVKYQERLSKTVAGLNFHNPIGLAAGFDKNALFYEEMGALGFGFVEVGTVTPLAQDGNTKPRLFRLPKDKALINRMGFNNYGVDAMVEQLKKRKDKKLIVGGNIGKNKITPNEQAANDYFICFEKLHSYVDYFVVNVSSPNTPNLRALQDKDSLLEILGGIQERNEKKEIAKPVFLKIAPDLSNEQLDEIINIVEVCNIAGIIATNTTISREGLQSSKFEVEKMGAGGLSGLPLKNRSMEVLRYLRTKSKASLIIISSGGIMDAREAEERIDAGADLIQLYTGFIYEGPWLISRIKQALLSKINYPKL